MDRATYELECAIAAALPTLKTAMSMRGLSFPEGEDELLITSLVGSIAGWVKHTSGKPRRIRRHEECLDCDTGWHQHDPDPEDDDDDGWHTHCDVCGEMWPCPEAGQIDVEELEQVRTQYLKLARKHPDKLTRHEWIKLFRITDTLKAEGALPTPEETVLAR